MDLSLTLEEVLGAGEMTYGAGLRDAVVADFSGRMFLYLVTGSGGGVTAIEVQTDGTLTVIDSVPLAASFAPGIEPRVSVTDLGSGPLLLLSGQAGDARSVSLLPDGRFGAFGPIGGDDSILVHPTSIVGPDGTYLVSGGPDGLISYAVAPTGDLTFANSIGSDADTLLADISDTATVAVAGQAYVLSTSAIDNSLTVLSLGTGGLLTRIGDIAAADGFGFEGISAIETASVDGRVFAILAASGSDSLSVVEISEAGVPTLRDHVVDDLSTRFQSVEAIAVATIGDRVFVAAGGSDDGISVFVLAPGGRLVHAATVVDSVNKTVSDVSALALAESNGQLEVMAAGASEFGLTRFSIDLNDLGATVTADEQPSSLLGTQDDDLLVGGMFADTLNGSHGDDVLIDGGGSDWMLGGGGADLFVLEADGQRDTISDFEPGVDRLDLSAFPLLYEPSQLEVEAQNWGVQLIWRSEIIDIYLAGGGSIDASDWTASDILDLDRPQFLPIPQLLEGTVGDDALRGGEGADTLTGDGGVDTLEGEGGNDLIKAGTGNDVVAGGNGADSLFGDAGFDELRGDEGSDRLWGGNEADLLYGGAGSDRMYGEGGVDNIFGGDGDDVGYGGAGNDRLYGGAGEDSLFGDTEEDRLFGESGDDELHGGAGFDRLEGGPGHDLLFGGAQADNIFGGADDDTLFGDGGFDRLFGGDGADELWGGEGPDALFGEGGNDTLMGGDDLDRFFGGQGNDILFGNFGDDELRGDAGFDTLVGGEGNDTLSGNFNADTFVFADAGGADVITDFEVANSFEKIDLSGLSSITDFDDLLANHLVQVAGDAMILGEGGDRLTLLGIDAADLSADDFLF